MTLTAHDIFAMVLILIGLISSASILIGAVLLERNRSCSRCGASFRPEKKERAKAVLYGPELCPLCPACERADSIFSTSRDWPETPNSFT